jgi:hypothetical protein
MMRRHIRSFFVVTALLATPLRARAQDAAEEARAAAKEGLALFDAKDYAGAVGRFETANQRVPSPQYLVLIARGQVGLGKLIEAREAYRRAIAMPLPDQPAEKYRKGFLAAQAAAATESAELQKRIPVVELAFTGAQQAPIRVVIDSRTSQIAPQSGVLRAEVNPGSHTFTATAEGFVAASATLDVRERTGGPPPRIELTPKPVEAPAAEAPPSSPADAPKVQAELPGPPSPVEERVPPGWPAQKKAGAALMVLGAAGVVVGGVFVVVAYQNYSALNGACPGHVCAPVEASRVTNYRAYSTGAVVSFIGAGALLTSGIVVYATTPSAKAQTGIFIKPRVGAGYLGVEGGF